MLEQMTKVKEDQRERAGSFLLLAWPHVGRWGPSSDRDRLAPVAWSRHSHRMMGGQPLSWVTHLRAWAGELRHKPRQAGAPHAGDGAEASVSGVS